MAIDNPNYRKLIEEDMSRLQRLLREAVPGHPAGGNSSTDKPLEILNVACGRCDEALTLARHFAGTNGAPVRLTGLDIRERELAEAAENARRAIQGIQRKNGANALPAAFDFFKADASQLDRVSTINDPGVVFFRHQNFWNGKTVWEAIFDQALERLDDDGQFVITSYFDREHELAMEAIKRLGGELLKDIRNPDSRSLDHPDKSVDRRIAVFRKR